MDFIVFQIFIAVYGVFARKTIPKRTQFGPIEGVLVKHDDSHVIPTEESHLELLVESETGSMLKLDTSCESKLYIYGNILSFIVYSVCCICPHFVTSIHLKLQLMKSGKKDVVPI